MDNAAQTQQAQQNSEAAQAGAAVDCILSRKSAFLQRLDHNEP